MPIATRVLAATCLTAGLLIGCSDDSPPSPTGTLVFHADAAFAPTGSKAMRTCELVDIRTSLHELAVSTGVIVEGEADTLTWHTVYVGTGVLASWSTYNVVIDLPPGTYTNYKFTWGAEMQWGLDDSGTEVVVPDTMHSEVGTRATINNMGGCWGYDTEGKFKNLQASETAEGFVITASTITDVLWQFNCDYADWYDNDDSGTWTSGDTIDVLLNVGATAMFQFVVTY
jgi:hypothetical protein